MTMGNTHSNLLSFADSLATCTVPGHLVKRTQTTPWTIVPIVLKSSRTWRLNTSWKSSSKSFLCLFYFINDGIFAKSEKYIYEQFTIAIPHCHFYIFNVSNNFNFEMTKNSDYSLFILLWDLVKVWNVHFIDRISVGLSKNFFRKDRIDHYQDLYLVRQIEPAFKANVRGLYWLVRSQESGLSCKISEESITES